MKKLLIALVMMGAASTMNAQEVFNYLLDKSEKIVNNPKASDFDLKVNQFKVTALRYIPTTGIKMKGGVSTEFMDVQAYSMNAFILSYFKALQTTPEAGRKDCIMRYVKATRENPLYEDKDIENTEAFVNDPGGYTPFSINVNWENALAAIEGEKK